MLTVGRRPSRPKSLLLRLLGFDSVREAPFVGVGGSSSALD